MTEYTDLAIISSYLKRDLTNSEVATLSVFLPAIRTWIDRKLGTTFLEVDATTRIYDGGGRSVDIDPVTDISAVKALHDDGTDSYDYTNLTEYNAYPQNENVKTEIIRRTGNWPRGAGRIAVTGKFSSYDGGVPEDIQTAATRIASDLIQQGAFESSPIKSETLEGHSVTYGDPQQTVESIATNDPLVKSILDHRRELSVG